jgi:formamidopyrimidine-DNA glycosylase
MDQRLIAGIGNIYSSEILFDSSIDPWKPARDLTRAELERLGRATHRILSAAIAEGGTSILSFQDAEGRRGGHQNSLQVYSRSESPCPRCDSTILKANLGGRATYYCPGCQRK